MSDDDADDPILQPAVHSVLGSKLDQLVATMGHRDELLNVRLDSIADSIAREIGVVKAELARLETLTGSHNQQIAKLERWQAKTVGLAFGASTMGSLMAGIVVWALGG